MTKVKSIPMLVLTALLMAGAAVSLSAATAAGRVAISTSQVAAAINDAGLRVAPKQITLFANVLATTRLPMLKVQSIEPWVDNRMKVRLSCTKLEECLPFYVSVSGDEVVTQPIPAHSNGASEESLQPKGSANSVVIRAGSAATLLIDEGRIHIQLPVICLENGAAGQSIRVTSKDRKTIYKAQVIDRAILRGSL